MFTTIMPPFNFAKKKLKGYIEYTVSNNSANFKNV